MKEKVLSHSRHFRVAQGQLQTGSSLEKGEDIILIDKMKSNFILIMIPSAYKIP